MKEKFQQLICPHNQVVLDTREKKKSQSAFSGSLEKETSICKECGKKFVKYWKITDYKKVEISKSVFERL